MATKTETKRTNTDPELLAMSRITRVLSGLDAAERERVLSWLNSRHGSHKPASGNGDDGTVPFGGK